MGKSIHEFHPQGCPRTQPTRQTKIKFLLFSVLILQTRSSELGEGSTNQ